MHFKIADFLIEVAEINSVPPPLNLFRVKGKVKSPDIKISKKIDSFPSFRNKELIFKSEGFWEIYNWQNKIVFWDRLNETRLKEGGRFAVFNKELTRGKIYFNDTNKHPLSYPLGALLVLNKLSQRNGLFLHASSVKDKDGRGYVFCGPSGIGKTTIAGLWYKGRNGTVLNDDRIILRKINKKFYIYGNPWYTKYTQLISNQKAGLDKLFFLKQSKKNFVRRLNPEEAFRRIISQAYFAIWERSAINFSFHFLNDLCQKIPCFELGFKPTEEIIEFIKKV